MKTLYRACTQDAAGNKGGSPGSSSYTTFTTSVAADTTAPVLSTPSVSSISTNTTISWTTNESGDTSVAYGTTPSFNGIGTGTSGTTSHSVTLTGLTPSTTYYYRACTQDAAGNQGCAPSSYATFTTNVSQTQVAPSSPAAPVVAATSSSSLNVSWNGVSGAVLYSLWRSTSNNTASATQIQCISGTSFTDSGSDHINPSTTYYYWVRAASSGDGALCSAPSDAKCVGIFRFWQRNDI